MEFIVGSKRLVNTPATQWVRTYLSSHIRAGSVVLDLGCDGCEILESSARVHPETMFVGFHQGGRRSRELCHEVGSIPNICFLRGEPDELPFGDETFDMVYSRFHLRLPLDLDAVLNEISRVVKPGGRIVLQDLACLPELSRPLYQMVSSDLQAVFSVLSRLSPALFFGQCLATRLTRFGFTNVNMGVQSCETGKRSLDRSLWTPKVEAIRSAIQKEIGEEQTGPACHRFIEYVCRPQPFMTPMVCTVTAVRED